VFPWPYLDRAGFSLRSVMPASDIALVAALRPGFIESQCARAQSLIEARLRKNYAGSLPLGGAAPPLSPMVTVPPAPPASLVGVPTVGSMRLYLQIVAPGNDGTATFKWSLDGGATFCGSVGNIAVTFGGIGYSATPTVTIDPPPPGGTQATATATVVGGVITAIVVGTPGTGYTALPNVTITDATGTGATAAATAITPIPVTIPAYNAAAPTAVYLSPTGLSVIWSAGAYLTSYVYQAPTPVPETVLQWIVQIVTPDVYNARGRNPADPYIAQLEADRTRVLGTDGKSGELHEAADGQNGLLDLPVDDALGSAQTTGPLATSFASPYASFDYERQQGIVDDYNGQNLSDVNDSWDDR